MLPSKWKCVTNQMQSSPKIAQPSQRNTTTHCSICFCDSVCFLITAGSGWTSDDDDVYVCIYVCTAGWVGVDGWVTTGYSTTSFILSTKLLIFPGNLHP